MRLPRDATAILLGGIVACVLFTLFEHTRAHAQEAGQAEKVDAKYDAQLIEEIIVRGETWRPERPDTQQWRSVNPTVDPPSRVRMSLGYDATEQRLLRSDNPLHDLSRRTPEPATVIRFRF